MSGSGDGESLRRCRGVAPAGCSFSSLGSRRDDRTERELDCRPTSNSDATVRNAVDFREPLRRILLVTDILAGGGAADTHAQSAHASG